MLFIPLICPMCHKPIDCCCNKITSELACDNCINFDHKKGECKKEYIYLDVQARAKMEFCECTRLEMIRYVLLKDIENSELWYENRKLEAKILWQTSKSLKEND